MKVKLQHLMLLLAAVGMLVSIYLTLVHYAGVPLVCSQSGLINCNNVLNSQYAYILGLPIAIYGVLFFIGEFIVLWFFKHKDLLLLYNGVGIAFVCYFLYIEYEVGNICEYCTMVHIVVVALMILSVYADRKGLEHLLAFSHRRLDNCSL